MSWQEQGPGQFRRASADTGMLASDGDRDAAVRELSEAFAEGRLTAQEHGERVRAALAARTWHELAQLTADLPCPAPAGQAPASPASVPAGLVHCLQCALLICCPPAGIAWLLTTWQRAHARQRQALATAGPSPYGSGRPARAGVRQRAEDR